jgi:hypothetical protein
VDTSANRRRRWTIEIKRKIAEESFGEFRPPVSSNSTDEF